MREFHLFELARYMVEEFSSCRSCENDFSWTQISVGIKKQGALLIPGGGLFACCFWLRVVAQKIGFLWAMHYPNSDKKLLVRVEWLGSTATDSVDFTQVIFAIPGLLGVFIRRPWPTGHP